MICYRLRCDGSHGFEAWFRSGADFDRQAALGLLECPACGSVAVERALMAPAIHGRGKREPTEPALPGSAVQGEVIEPSRMPAAAAGGEIPAALRALFTRMRDEVERHCDDVGADFADQALRMHRGEMEKRGIYGKTTEVEREILADEGVEIARIPWIKRADG